MKATSTLSQLLHDWESVMESILNNSIEEHEKVKSRQIWIELLRTSKLSMLGATKKDDSVQIHHTHITPE
eukprot:CAMPEP_0178977918 /NCGR_PEP_ID=MMETSP0789-20121207/24815_1 /TAXON_ID=3005 /ORGANISM="Rhizosolenia setigera, Strain CCMP 1694" /LENGTH=69 /DNA_ID=CAMNT_0020667489 /DNA_START=348 /DNA_END=554 /DNA_ORIENTATION=-